MYPSKRHIRYGVFVKNFERAIENDFDIQRNVLTKRTTFTSKLFGYVNLYLNILILIFKAKEEDIIYVHFPLHLAPVLWIVRLFKKNLVLNFHGSDLVFDRLFTQFLSVFLKSVVKKSLVVVPSSHYKIKITTIYGIDSHRVLVYPSGGIDSSVFYPRETKKSDTFVLGFVSNFIASKGWEVFLLAVQSIVKNNTLTNIELLMVGEGPDTRKISDLLETINVKSTVIESVSQKELAVIYNSMDVFLFPTFRESLGLVGLEAMASGTPIIASKVDGPSSYIQEGINGYLFKSKDYLDLENKIIKVYNLPTIELEKLRSNAIKTAKLYDHNTVNKQLLLFLRQL